MKKDFCYIGFVLDRSGSMQSYGIETVVSGFNRFVKEQKETPGEAHLYFVQFDTEGYDKVYDGDIKKKADMAAGDFVPRGGTPLRDAIGKTITDLGKRFEHMSESDRPDKVVIVILTDGLENASREYTAAQIAGMIKTQQQQYNWQFVFLGANQDAILTGEQYGMNVHNAANLGTTSRAFAASMAFTTSNLRNYRVSGQSASLNYSAEQRKEIADDPNTPVVVSTTTTTTTAQRPKK